MVCDCKNLVCIMLKCWSERNGLFTRHHAAFRVVASALMGIINKI